MRRGGMPTTTSTHRRGFLLTALAAALVAPRAGEAQPPGKMYRIGWLVPAPPSDRRWEAFKAAMAERGWLDGRDFTVDGVRRGAVPISATTSCGSSLR